MVQDYQVEFEDLACSKNKPSWILASLFERGSKNSDVHEPSYDFEQGARLLEERAKKLGIYCKTYKPPTTEATSLEAAKKYVIHQEQPNPPFNNQSTKARTTNPFIYQGKRERIRSRGVYALIVKRSGKKTTSVNTPKCTP